MAMSPQRVLMLFALLILAAYGEVHAQRFRGFGGYGMEQNDPPPESEFVFARWQYGSGMSGGWWHDYPRAEEHINQIMNEATGIKTNAKSYRIVPMSSKEMFDYPFGYISEPGMMWLSDIEVKNQKVHGLLNRTFSTTAHQADSELQLFTANDVRGAIRHAGHCDLRSST